MRLKLFSPACRYYTDNGSSLIGKGNQLYQLREWFEKTNPDSVYCTFVASYVFTYTLWNVIPYSTWRHLMDLPIGFPPNAGGMNFPVSQEYMFKHFEFELAFIGYLVNDCPLDKFMYWTARISDIHTRNKYKMESPSYSDIYSEYLCDIIRSLPRLEEHVVFWPPDHQNTLVPINSALEYICRFETDIRISAITGRPHLVESLKRLYDKHGYISLDSLDTQLERSTTYMKAFSERRAVPKHSTIHSFIKNSHRFWQSIRTSLCDLPRKGWWPDKGLSQIQWLLKCRKLALIHKSHLAGYVLSEAPNLFLDIQDSSPARYLEFEGCEFTTRQDGVQRSYLSGLTDTLEEDQLLEVVKPRPIPPV